MLLDYIVYLIFVTRLNKHREHIKAKHSCLKLAEVTEFLNGIRTVVLWHINIDMYLVHHPQTEQIFTIIINKCYVFLALKYIM